MAAMNEPMAGAPVIVLVEDDDALRGALVRMLSISGFDVLPFATAEDARDAAPWDRTACLLADVRLPGMTGLDFIDWLRRNGHPVPVIAMTAAPTQQACHFAKRLGVRAFLEKPIPLQVLVAAIRAAIVP